VAAPTGRPIRWQERGGATALVSTFLIVVSATPAIPLAPAGVSTRYFNDSNRSQGATRRRGPTRPGVRGARLAKERRDSPRRIDAAVAAVMAHDRAAALAGVTRDSIYI
jgi:hypothetical protein